MSGQFVLSRRIAVLVLSLLATHASPLVAQRVGITVARTQSDVVTSYGDNTGGSYPNRAGIAAGISYRHPLRPGILLQPEALLVQRGWTTSQPTLSLTYVEVPVLLRFGALTSERARFRPVLTVGPTLNVLVRCGLTGLGIARAEGPACSRRIVEPFVEDYSVRRLDVGALVGVGAEARLTGGTIVGVEGRYERGLLDVRPGAVGDARNSTFFVMLNVVPAARRSTASSRRLP